MLSRFFKGILWGGFALLLTVLFLLIVFWDYRPGNPGTIDLNCSKILKLGSMEIALPLKRGSEKTMFWMDGGSVGVEFVDNRNQTHILCFAHCMGDQNHWGDIYLRAPSPRSKNGENIGKSDLGAKLIYSVCLRDQQRDIYGCRVVDRRYPTFGTILKGKPHQWIEWIRLNWWF